LTEAERCTIVRHKPSSLPEYYLTRIAKWCRTQWQLDTRFTPLGLLVDQRSIPEGGKTHTFTNLSDVLAAQPDNLAFVLLGSPGSGKSTLLQQREWETALTASHLNPTETLIPFFASLNQYKAQTNQAGELYPSPWGWLNSQWYSMNPQLADFTTQMQTGRILLLLDALNEMPHKSDKHYQALLDVWRNFLHKINEYFPGNRVVFSCRELNYSIGLSNPDGLPVQHIRIESLNPGQIHKFLQRYHPEQADELFQQLKQAQQLDFYNKPYFLKLLIEQTKNNGGTIPKGRAALFTGFVQQALARELAKPNTLLKNQSLLTAREQEKWSNPQRRNMPYQL